MTAGLTALTVLAAMIAATGPLAAADLACRSENGRGALTLAGYDGSQPLLELPGRSDTPLKLLSGGTQPIYQGVNDDGELLTFMLDTTTGRYGFNAMAESGITEMDAGNCGRAA
ncbi:hypothetical protein [Paracoccus sediminicola]|uniref:hypothetical protein n=1 Tax=Paracoccus sediminicola TaxID=3017783 RepID=UPI0022F04131|nr:hypothetical protein [Paracoccus sediminicola]WBU55455.1 hypothetical protein PAF18_07895 [Paracoccus sediminicola]